MVPYLIINHQGIQQSTLSKNIWGGGLLALAEVLKVYQPQQSTFDIDKLLLQFNADITHKVKNVRAVWNYDQTIR